MMNRALMGLLALLLGGSALGNTGCVIGTGRGAWLYEGSRHPHGGPPGQTGRHPHGGPPGHAYGHGNNGNHGGNGRGRGH